MKKTKWLGLVILCGIVIIGILEIKRNQRFDFDSVTDGRAEDVVTVQGPKNEDATKWLDFLKKQSFIVCRGELGNTARQRYVMYDAYRNEIFAVTDVGNRNLIIIEIDGKEKVYQICEK